jgi:Domain of Unknown Function (DUF748)
MPLTSRLPRRLFVGALCLIGLILAWTAFGFLAVPHILRSVAVSTVRERMHRELSLGEIRFNPLRLELTVADASLPDANGGPLVGLRRVDVTVQLLRSITMRGPVLGDLEIDGLHVAATIGADGHLNLADLSQLKGPDTGDTSPTRLAIDRLAVTSGEVAFGELDRPQPFTLHLMPVRFELHNFSTIATSGNDYRFTARSDAGEALDWHGHLYLDPLRSDGEFQVAALQAGTIGRYLGDALPFTISSGHIDATGSYQLLAGDGPLQLSAAIGQLDVQDVGLRPRTATEDYVHVSQLRVANAHADVAKRHAEVGRVELNGAQIHAWRDAGGSVNLAALAGTSAPVASPVAEGRATATWTWDVAEIAVRGVAVSAEDRGITPAAHLAIHDLALGIKGLSQDETKPLLVNLALRLDESGQVASQGTLRRDSLAYHGRLTIKDLDLTPAQPYLQQFTDMTLLSGKLNAAMDIERTAQSLTARGDADVSALRAIDNVLKQDFLKWSRLLARGTEFRLDPLRLHVREVVADEPYARVIVGDDRTLNISHVLHPPGWVEEDGEPAAKDAPAPTTSTSATPHGQAADIAIGIVRIKNGSMNFADLWIKPNFAVGILDLGGTITGLSSQSESRATVDLKGSVNRYAPAVISGQINPLSATVYSDISMSFRNIDMTSASPYSGHFAGYEISKGKLSAEFSYKINDRKLDAGHHLVLDQFELGERVESPDATSLPVRLAIALLKDRHGVIDISLPVTGSLDDPKFRLAPLVWKAIVNIVVKVATAPFALLGKLFGGGDEVNQVSFVPGTAQLDDAGRQHLESLRKAMVERPGLRLDVPAAYSNEIDRPAMLQRQLEAQLAAVAAKAGPDRYRQLVAAWHEEAGEAPLPSLAAAFEGDRRKAKDPHPPEGAVAQLEQALVERFVVSDEELLDLGKRRATTVQDTLFATQEIDPLRVFVVAGSPAAADDKQLRVDLVLK